MGRVLLGSGPDGRLVAVKLVDEQYVDDPSFRTRFRREVKASRKVAGAYTAAVIDADADAPTPWFASVYVPGPSLSDAVAAAGVLGEEAALRLAAGLAAALIEIRRAGLVHRDLKPSNVLLTDDGLRVIDFGVARAIEVDGGTQVTRTGGLVGTPRFMSPEQALGREPTTASDIFSLGSVLVFACTGRGPFDAANTPRILHNVVHADPALGDLPGRVREVVLSCLNKDLSRRPTPEWMLGSIRLGPAARPWPAGVHRLIAEQHAEVGRLLPGAPQEPFEPPTVVDPLTVVDPPSGPPPGRSPGTGAGLVTRRRALVGGGVLVGLAAVGGTVGWATSVDDKPARKGGAAKASSSAGWKLLGELTGSPGTVDDVLYSPDGRLLATTCRGGTVRLWDVPERRLSGEPIRVTDDGSPAVTFSRTGDVLATASKEGAKLWDVSSRQQIGETLTVAFTDVLDAPGPVIDVGYSPDGDTLAGAGSSILQLWDARSRSPIGKLNLGRPDLLVKINFSGDGRTLALPDDQTIRLWDVTSRKEVGTALLGHTAAIATAVMSPDGRTLATGAWDTTVRLWDIPGRRPIGQPLRGHSHVIQGLAFSPDGRTLASGCADGTARLWDVARRRALGTPIKADTRDVTGVSFDLEGHTLAIGVGKTVQLWDVSGRVSD
jgi:WD40 repeat protein